MPDPYDYTSAFANVPAPGDSFMAGIKNGVALTDIQTARAQQERDLAAQQQKKAVIQALVSNPNASADDYAKATVLVPELHAQFKQAWETKSTAQQQNDLKRITEWSAAIQSGQPKIASHAMRSQADAIENTAGAPTPESKSLRAKADQVDANPNAANFILKSMIAANPNGKAAIDGIVALGGEQRAADKAPADLAEANAKAAGAQADVTLKNLGIVGQTLGAMQGKGIKPEQAKAAIASLVTRGAIPKEERADWLAAVPSDPKELDAWLGTVRAGGMKPDDQMKYTTPDANAKLQAETSVKTTGMNVAGQQKVQEMITARQDSKGEAEASLDSETLTSMAQQYLAGDKSVMQNLGRGAQGSANIVALRKEITAQAKAQGMTGPAIAAKMAEFAGTMAGQRTAGNRIANVEMAANEAESLIPLARQASAEVSRSGLLVFGKAGNLFDSQTNDPKLRQFVAANNALVNVYSRAISPSGTPTVSDKEHARELLQTAYDQKSYNAVLDQMQKEISAARSAPQAVRKAFNGAVTGQDMGHGGAAKPAPAIPTGWTVREH